MALLNFGINITGNQDTAVPFPYDGSFGRETALPYPLYDSGVDGIDIIPSHQQRPLLLSRSRLTEAPCLYRWLRLGVQCRKSNQLARRSSF